MAADAFIHIRVTSEMKELARTLALREGITESKLLKQFLEMLLRTWGVGDRHRRRSTTSGQGSQGGRFGPLGPGPRCERRTADLKPPGRFRPPRLVQKLVFSMPAGTTPNKILAAVKDFAREEFALKHRYAMMLHTDEPQPHVHLVVKAMGEDGTRLNIRRATLRKWRREFASHLREQGVAANATERVIRGETTPRKADGIHRAALRGVSSHWRQRAAAVADELASHGLTPEVGKAQLLETRRQVISGGVRSRRTLSCKTA